MPVYHTADHLRAASWKLSSRNELQLFIFLFFFFPVLVLMILIIKKNLLDSIALEWPDVCLLLLFTVNYSVLFSMLWLGVPGRDLEVCFGLGLGHTLNNSTTQKQPPR